MRFEVPGPTSGTIGTAMEAEGYFLGFRSEYLVRRNWVRFA
ncbi:MAG: hypothetical protein P8177_12695 [Gemmatimonadota bacterium]